MILTDKAKEDFLQWNKDNGYIISEYVFNSKLVSETVINALIMEWFDSVGIYIDIVIVFKKDTPKYVYYYGRYTNQSQQYNTRKEATKQAIIKANEIYNEQNSIRL